MTAAKCFARTIRGAEAYDGRCQRTPQSMRRKGAVASTCTATQDYVLPRSCSQKCVQGGKSSQAPGKHSLSWELCQPPLRQFGAACRGRVGVEICGEGQCAGRSAHQPNTWTHTSQFGMCLLHDLCLFHCTPAHSSSEALRSCYINMRRPALLTEQDDRCRRREVVSSQLCSRRPCPGTDHAAPADATLHVNTFVIIPRSTHRGSQVKEAITQSARP